MWLNRSVKKANLIAKFDYGEIKIETRPTADYYHSLFTIHHSHQQEIASSVAFPPFNNDNVD